MPHHCPVPAQMQVRDDCVPYCTEEDCGGFMKPGELMLVTSVVINVLSQCLR